jgi:tetratricopeptide (TPR) repeat protein
MSQGAPKSKRAALKSWTLVQVRLVTRGVQTVTATGLNGSAAERLARAATTEQDGARAKYATQGAKENAEADLEGRVLRLRQHYLAHMEARAFADASSVAAQMVALGVLTDLSYQDWSRAELALGNTAAAIEHVRSAVRHAPASRRAFHWWTLGSLLQWNGQVALAVDVFGKAARWAASSRPLMRAQLELARWEADAGSGAVPAWRQLREELASAPCGAGYGEFVRGLLAYAEGDRTEAQRCLNAFVQRIRSGRVALQVGLHGEVERAQAVLAALG